MNNNILPLNWNGIAVGQPSTFYSALDQLFIDFRKNNILDINIFEIGTDNGGSACILAEKCLEHGITYNIVTLDNRDNAHQRYSENAADLKRIYFEKFKIKFILCDHFSEIAFETVRQMMAENKKCLIFCDGWPKGQEFSIYAQFLRPGDLIFAHDYAYNREVFDSQIRGIYWNVLETQEADISEACRQYNLVPFMQETFATAVWASRTKIV